MKTTAFISTLTLALGTLALGSGMAQADTSVRVAPGFFCEDNNCVRFSHDLSEVSIQSRRPVSVESYGLARNPVISDATYREIFKLALVQVNVGRNN